MSANSIELSKNSGNLGQNVQYFSQIATLFVAFPIFGHSSQLITSLWGFFPNIQEILIKINTVVVIMGTNEGTIQIFSEAGSFIWWLMRIF